VRLRVAAPIVFAAATALYLPTIGFAFTYDDVPIVVNEPLLHSLANWRTILVSPWWENGLYRPLTALTLAANWSLLGGEPWGFHAVNAVLHGLATALVLVLAARYLSPLAALGAAALFAVHPVHVEAVANVVGRAELLATIFTLLAALLYAADGDAAPPGPRPPGLGRLATSVGTVVAVLCAFASKESALAAPGILLLVDWLAARRAGEPGVTRFRRHWLLWAAVLALALEWIWLRAGIVGNLAGAAPAPGLEGKGPLARLMVMLPVVLEYLRLLFVPARLSLDYSPDYLPAAGGLTARLLAGALVLAASVWLAVRVRARMPVLTFAFGWMAASLFIVWNVVIPSGVLLAERTLYLASVGACLVVAAVYQRLVPLWPRVAAGAVMALGLAGALRAWTRVPVWRSNETLFPQLVRDAPGSFRGDWVAAMLAYQAGDQARGEQLMRQGFATYGSNGVMWDDYARQLEREGRWREASDAFWRAFTVDPSLVRSAAGAVASALQAGATDTAEARLGAALRRYPDRDELRLVASHLAMARGQPLRAMTLRRQVAQASPETWQYWYLTADAAAKAGYCPELVRALGRMRLLQADTGTVALVERQRRRLACGDTAPGPSSRSGP
jgi:tetratricopeptide (TPR) repeat protein